MVVAINLFVFGQDIPFHAALTVAFWLSKMVFFATGATIAG